VGTPTVDPSLQQRVRLLANLRGGDLISVADFVQPTMQVAAWGATRNPPLEIGDQLVRVFNAEMSVAGVAAQIAWASIRVAAGTGVILWLRSMMLSEHTGGAQILTAGRTAATVHASSGTAVYEDTRLPMSNLSAAPIGIGGGTSVAAFPTMSGHRWLTLRVLETMTVDLDVVLDDQGSGNGDFTVENTTVAQPIRVSFQGLVFPNLR
jgi:RNA 3'-terminal phosphate cyclase